MTRTIARALFWGALFVGLYILATHINWVGDGYCWGTIDKCFLGGK